ncbi:MAG: transporter [Hellea sp.]|nr:transporter [Hellea sp.]
MNAVTLPVVGLLLLTPFCIAVGQLLFKMSSEKLVTTGANFYTVLFNPVFILALAIYGSATLLWIYVLKSVPLVYAYSFMALSFVFVPILAFFFLQEQFTLRYFAGALLIISGLAIIQN